MMTPAAKIGGDALIVITEPNTAYEFRGSFRDTEGKWQSSGGRVPILTDIASQISAMGMSVTTATTISDGLTALRKKRFDLVISRHDMSGRWDLCAEVTRQRQRSNSTAGVIFLPSPLDSSFVFVNPEDPDALKCPWEGLTWPLDPVVVIGTMQRFCGEADFKSYMVNVKSEVENDGFALVPDILDAGHSQILMTQIEDALNSKNALRRGETKQSVYGVRNLLDAVPAIRMLANAPRIRALVEPILGEDCFPVRGILFDKTPNASWKVPWHQDLTIAVRARHDTPGYGPWSEKSGVAHVQPPVAVLERMLAVRLHLDPCGAENGFLRVLPGTHTGGRLNAMAIEQARRDIAPHDCLADAGDALLMRPLLLHASSAATSPAHRRVIHLEFANVALDGGLEWQAAAGKISA